LIGMLAPTSRRRRALPHVALATALLLGACAGERPELSDTREPAPTSTIAPEVTTTAPANPPAVVAQAKADSIQIFDDATVANPTDRFDGGVITAADATSAPGIPIVFLVKDATEDNGRYEVYLPVRPNGSTGWVNTSDVDVTNVTYRIKVSIGEHRLRVFDGDDIIVDEPVGVGTVDRPTPGGVYYLKELLQPPDPNGPYGTFAYGLSGFSNVLTSFNGGAGVIGIHGTNDPGAVGTDVSSGCIRLTNDVINRLVNDIGLPLGTPVEILA